MNEQIKNSRRMLLYTELKRRNVIRVEALVESYGGKPIAVQVEPDIFLGAEREKTLQMMCFNNPVPDEWQPLPETWERVTQH